MTYYAIIILQLVVPAALLATVLLILAGVATAIGLYFLDRIVSGVLAMLYVIQDRWSELQESRKVWE